MKKECFLSYNKALPLIALIMVLLVAFALLIPSLTYAEEIDGNEYVNFNQIVPNNYINISFTTYNNWVDFSSNLNVNHLYYIRFSITGYTSENSTLFSSNSTHDTRQILFVIDHNGDYEQLKRPNYNYLSIYLNTTLNFINFNAIDLTLMYGSGSEPSLEQCQQLFIADYYYYTSGTPITIDGLGNYNEGVAQALSSMQYTEISSDLANNMDTCIINSDFGSTNKALIQGFFTWGNNAYTNTTAVLGLGATLLQNDYITFKYKCLGSQSTLSLPPTTNNMGSVHIYGLGQDGTMYKIATCEGYVGDTFKEVSFKIPFDLENLYLVADGQKYIVAYNNFELNITTMNLTAVLNHAYNQGQKQLRSYYSIGGEGYTQIYNSGVADGMAQGNAFANGLSIIGTTFAKVGEIMQLEILPNIPLSVFVLLPLLVGIVVFVVKMTKGS